MEKISGVLGSSPRLKSTDLQSSSAIRPGMPTFGRPVGETTIAQRKDLTTAQKANMIREKMALDKKTRAEVRSIERMQEQFFLSKPDIQVQPAKVDQIINEVAELRPQIEEGEISLTDPNLSDSDMKFTPKGSYVDVSA